MTGSDSSQASDKPVLTGQAALDAAQVWLATLEGKQVSVYNLDSTHVSTVFSAAYPRLEAMWASLERLPDFNLAAIRALPTLVPALVYSHALVQAHSPEAAEFDELAIEARARRETLLLAVEMLVDRKLVAKSTVDKIRAGQGVYDLIEDLGALLVLAEKHDAEGALVAADVRKRVAELIDLLPREYAQKLGKHPALGPLLEQRRKLGALVVRGYGEARAGVAFLRRDHDDAELITPSIYVLRGASKKDVVEEPADKPAPAPAPAKPANPLLPSDNPFDDKS